MVGYNLFYMLFYLASKIKGFGLVLEKSVKGVQLIWPHTVDKTPPLTLKNQYMRHPVK
jgi:hypothetical protein